MEERRRIAQQWLDFFLHSIKHFCSQFLLLITFGSQYLIRERVDLREECVNEKTHPRPCKSTRWAFATGWIEPILGKRIRKEGADYGRLGDDLILKYTVAEFNCRHQTSRIDFQVPRLTWAIERDNNFLVWKVELLECNCGSMSPGTAMVGIKGSIEVLATASFQAAD